MPRHSMLAAALAVFAVCFLAPSALADGYIKTRIETSGFAGLGGSKGEIEVWVAGPKLAERSKLELSSPLLRAVAGGSSRVRTVTDLDRRVMIEIDEEEKAYREVPFDELKAKMEESRETMREAYTEAKSGGEASVPRARPGERPEVRLEILGRDEEKKFAGMKAKRSTLKMFATGTDQSTGEEVDFKVTYDVWLTPAFPANDEFQAFSLAYGDLMGDGVTEQTLSLATALGSAGLDMNEFSEHASQLEGYPVKATISVGSVLTAEQKARLAEMQAEAAASKTEKKKGGFGSIGGLGKKLKDQVQDSVEDKVAEEVAERLTRALFGEGVGFDEDGDPVFFSTTTEVVKVETKSVDPKRFLPPKDYEKRP